jgi:PAS domain S-box-containing protein
VSEVNDQGLLTHAVEYAPDGVIIVDPDGEIVYANRSMRRLAGSKDLVGSPVDELVPSALRAGHALLREGYQEAPVARPMGAGLELLLERRDGSTLPVEVSLSPLAGRSYVICTVRDISERLENQARLSAANEQLALVDERERIGRDLHDVVLQHLYGMGLSVQAVAAGCNTDTRARLESIIDDVDRIISEVRTIVFTLGTASNSGALGQELADVVAQASRVLGFTPSLRLDGPVDSVLSPEVRTEMVASMREALGNVARHAQASQATVVVALADGHVVMTVSDNGVGPPTDDSLLQGGHGLHNLRQRAEAFEGGCELLTRPEGGAELCWRVPF